MIFNDAGSWTAPLLSRRSLVVLGGLTTAAATGWWRATPALAAAAQLDLDFSSGSLGWPISRHAGASLRAGYARTGKYGCRLNPATTARHVAYLVVDRRGFARNRAYATFRMYFRLVWAPKSADTYMNLFEIGSTSTESTKSQFTVFFRKGRMVCDFSWNETLDLGPVPKVGTWHDIQAIVHYGATRYTAKVSLDRAEPRTLRSANNKTPANVRVLWVHYPSVPVDYTLDVDEIKMTTATTAPGFFSAPLQTNPTTVTGFRESFENGAVGSQPTSANTAYDESIGDRGVDNGTIAAAFAPGGALGRCVQLSNTSISKNAFGFLGKRVATTKVMYFRRYYKLDVLPQYRMSVLLYKYGGTGNGQLGGVHNGSFSFGGSAQSHKFALVDDNTNATRSRSTVPLNSWFRVETKVDFTSGTGHQTVRLFLGGNVDGGTPDETLSARLAGKYTDYVEDGILTNPNVKVTLRIDEAANGTGWLGPAR